MVVTEGQFIIMHDYVMGKIYLLPNNPAGKFNFGPINT